MTTYNAFESNGKITIELLDWRNGNLIASHQATNNTIVMTLEHFAFNKIELPYVDLRGLNLSHAVIEGLIAPYALGDDTIFAFAKLNRADLSGAVFRECNFYSAKMSNVILTDGELTDCDLDRVKLNNSKLQGTDVSNSTFKEARINYAKLQNLNAVNANFDNAEMFATKIHGAQVTGASFKNVKMSELLAKGARPAQVFDDVIYVVREKQPA